MGVGITRDEYYEEIEEYEATIKDLRTRLEEMREWGKFADPNRKWIGFWRILDGVKEG